MPPRLPPFPCGSFLTSPAPSLPTPSSNKNEEDQAGSGSGFADIDEEQQQQQQRPRPPPNNIEIDCFLDLICPYSAKMFRTLYDDVVPGINNSKINNGVANVTIKIHHVIQPWHPQSTMVHEAALAVKKVLPGLYLGFIRNVYKTFINKNKFTDDDTWNKTRIEIYNDLLDCLPSWLENEYKQNVKELLYPSSSIQESREDGGSGSGSSSPDNNGNGNSGNGITQELKWACKYHRSRGVHVTPTVFANGIEATQISSSWKADDWNEFLFS